MIVDDIIYYKDMIYIVPKCKLKDMILRVIHDALLVGHRGYLKNLQASEGEIFLEGSQGGCTFSCEGVHDFSIEKVRVHTSCRTASSIADFRA